MVKIILALAGVVFVLGAILTTFDGTMPKVDSMQGNLAAGVSRLDKATRDYQADIAKVKLEAQEKSTLNEQRLAALKTEIEVKKYDKEYLKKVTSLDKRNTDMKLKMEYYSADGIDNWKVFKGNFNRDMEKITKECKELEMTVDKLSKNTGFIKE